MRIDEYPVSPALAERTLMAAKAARRRKRSAIGGVSAMALATAAVACVLFVPWRNLAPGIVGAATQPPALAAATGPSGTPEPENLQEERELPCRAVPLVGSFNYENIGFDGRYNLRIEPGGLDDALAEYGLKPDTRDSTAQETLNELRANGATLQLVLAADKSSTPRMSAEGLYMYGNRVTFSFTDCAGGPFSLYDEMNEAIGCYGFLVEIPPKAAELTFLSEFVPWEGVDTSQLEITVRRILTNAGAVEKVFKARIDSSKVADDEAVAEIYLQTSPKETAAILSMGRDAALWLKARCDSLLSSGAGEPDELLVLKALEQKLELVSNPAADMRKALEREGELSRHSIRYALEYDLFTHILELGGEEAGEDRAQVCATYCLREPAEDSSIQAAVLASVLDADGHASAPRLFVVDAGYIDAGDRTEHAWELEGWTITPIARLDQDDYPQLKYRGADNVEYSLYGELNWKLSGYADEPFEPDLKYEGQADMALMDAPGTLRWYRLSTWVRREKNAGMDNIEISTADYPNAGELAPALSRLSGGEWAPISELEFSKEQKTPNEPGLQRIQLEFSLLCEDGLWSYSCLFNAYSEKVTMSRCLAQVDGRGGATEYYVSKDSKLLQTMISALHIDTDVAGLLIDDVKGPSLPPDRDELTCLVAYVQDMPGGIAAVHPSIFYRQGGGFAQEELPSLTKKSDILAWAKGLRTLLGSLPNDTVHPIGALPANMEAGCGQGEPALLRWDVDVAAQEGAAILTIYANPYTMQVWSETSYRLYGTVALNTWYTVSADGDDSLYRVLTKLTFGREILDPAELPG